MPETRPDRPCRTPRRADLVAIMRAKEDGLPPWPPSPSGAGKRFPE